MWNLHFLVLGGVAIVPTALFSSSCTPDARFDAAGLTRALRLREAFARYGSEEEREIAQLRACVDTLPPRAVRRAIVLALEAQYLVDTHFWHVGGRDD